MKYVKIIFIAIIIGVLFSVITNNRQTSFDSNDYLRIHIRANSNLDVDQSIKYEIKDCVVQYLTPYLVGAHSKSEALDIVAMLTDEIEKLCDDVLLNNGFDYQSSARIAREVFPTRAYEDWVLDAGLYDALIINLGTGQGNNWWCVVYPPLCFVNKIDNSSQNIQYRSKLKEIIEEFFNR